MIQLIADGLHLKLPQEEPFSIKLDDIEVVINVTGKHNSSILLIYGSSVK